MSDWYNHDGQSWPEEAHPEEMVEVRYRGGQKWTATVETIWRLDGWKWDAFPDVSDIVRYRVLAR